MIGAWTTNVAPVRVLLLGFCLLSGACSEPQLQSNTLPPSGIGFPEPQLQLEAATSEAIRELTRNYLRRAQSDFSQANQAIAALGEAIDELLARPSAASLAAARQAWLSAHIAYETRLLHQYFVAQVLPAEQALRLSSLAYNINHWPVVPGYIDGVPGYPGSGIVNDMTVALNPDNLREIHGQFDPAEAALGFHVLEYLLWGNNSGSQTSRGFDSFTPATVLSEVQQQDGMPMEQMPNNRRRRMLALVMDMLYEDFQLSQELFLRAIGEYQQSLAQHSPVLHLSQLLQAINSMLTEEFLLRSLYPMLNGNYQVSIQSPYSQSTQNAVVAQIASIEYLLLEAVTSDGVRLNDVLTGLSADFEELFYQNLDASKECLVLLYSDIIEPANPEAAIDAEFTLVECINLLTNLIDHLQQMQQTLGAAPQEA